MVFACASASEGTDRRDPPAVVLKLRLPPAPAAAPAPVLPAPITTTATLPAPSSRPPSLPAPSLPSAAAAASGGLSRPSHCTYGTIGGTPAPTARPAAGPRTPAGGYAAASNYSNSPAASNPAALTASNASVSAGAVHGGSSAGLAVSAAAGGASVSGETWTPPAGQGGGRSFLGPLTVLPKATGATEEDVWLVTTVHSTGEGLEGWVYGMLLRGGPLVSGISHGRAQGHRGF